MTNEKSAENILSAIGSTLFGTSAVSLLNTASIFFTSIWLSCGWLLSSEPRPFTWFAKFLNNNLDIHLQKFESFVAWLNTEKLDSSSFYWTIPLGIAALISVQNGSLVNRTEDEGEGMTQYALSIFILLCLAEVTGRPGWLYIGFIVLTHVPVLFGWWRGKLQDWGLNNYLLWLLGVPGAPVLFMVFLFLSVKEIFIGDNLKRYS